MNVAGGGPIYWRGDIFGNDQMACITFKRFDPTGRHQSILLKVQGDWRQGAIAVFFDPAMIIRVETFIPGIGWQLEAGGLTPDYHKFQDGDTLGARASHNNITLFRNGIGLAEPRQPPWFHEKGGRVGLWFIDAPNAILDDFAAGTVTP
jgi:hypothetical protein